MILLSQWYTPKEPERLKELEYARETNSSLKAFSKIEYVDGDSRRWTYEDFFRHCGERYRGFVCVLANTDIVFNDSASYICSVTKTRTLVAITRWDSPESPCMNGVAAGEKFFSRTQDVWCFVGGEMLDVKADHWLGSPGCENRLVAEAVNSVYAVVNPAFDIRTAHLHSSPSRYAISQTAGPYGYPEITACDSVGRVLIAESPSPDGRVIGKVRVTCPR